QRSKTATEQSRNQKLAFLKASFLIELLHYYENQNTEAPDVIFAQRLPALVEQLASTCCQEKLQENFLVLVENLLGFIMSSDHRQMVVNNLGKAGGQAKTLKYVLKLRAEKVLEPDVVGPEFVKHLLPSGQKPPAPAELADIL